MKRIMSYLIVMIVITEIMIHGNLFFDPVKYGANKSAVYDFLVYMAAAIVVTEVAIFLLNKFFLKNKKR